MRRSRSGFRRPLCPRDGPADPVGRGQVLLRHARQRERRLREFGIMGAVGMKKRRLSLMILLEGLFLSGIAGLTGGTAGNLISWYLCENSIDLSAFFPPISLAGTVFLPELRCYLAVENMLIPVVMMIILGMVVALFPAHRLLKLNPVDVLREV